MGAVCAWRGRALGAVRCCKSAGTVLVYKAWKEDTCRSAFRILKNSAKGFDKPKRIYTLDYYFRGQKRHVRKLLRVSHPSDVPHDRLAGSLRVAEEALAQIDANGYSQRFAVSGKTMYKVALVFSSEGKGLLGWKVNLG